MRTPISITGIASVSALGMDSEEVWQSYVSGTPCFSEKEYHGETVKVGALSEKLNAELEVFQNTQPHLKKLDRSVILAIMAARKTLPKGFNTKRNVGINIGSSRGATSLFEKYHEEFQLENRVSALASPTTTLGNISSWVGQELGVAGPEISHSVTCSTSLQAILNGIAWLEADMADTFVVGGSEAPLTPFTIAQMQALKLYSRSKGAMACESLKFDKKSNTMVLGEAGAVAILEKGIGTNAVALISGYGYASEELTHNVSISESAECFQKSMQMALDTAGLDSVDAVVMHAPGTIAGDKAELNAVKSVFRNKMPALTTNKSILGHTLGASGLMSVEMAVLMLRHNQFIHPPFYKNNPEAIQDLNTIMVNAVGFGGNAVSIIVSK